MFGITSLQSLLEVMDNEATKAEFEIVFKADKKVINCNQHESNFIQVLKPYDCELISDVDGKRIKAHRHTLSAMSDYFKAMFEGNFRDSNAKEVTLADIPGDILEDLVKFSYIGKIELDTSTIIDLYEAAAFLQIVQLIDECANYMASKLEVSNCFAILNFAEKHSYAELLVKAEQFACEHFMEAKRTQDFLHLSCERLLKMLVKDEIDVTSEKIIFKAVVGWIRYDESKRKRFFDELLTCVRLPLLTSSYLIEDVLPLCESTKSKEMVNAAMTKSRLPSVAERHIICNRLMMIGLGDTDELQYRVYDPTEEAWTGLQVAGDSNSPSPVYFGLAAIRENVYIIGGFVNSVITNTLYKLNVGRSNKYMEPMKVSRAKLSTCTYKGHIYAIGGCSGRSGEETPLNSIERDYWDDIAPMSVARTLHASAILDDRLYVVGGYSMENGALNSLECLCLKTNTWSSCAGMETARFDLGLVAAKGYLYAVGGNLNFSTFTEAVERYDPSTNTWTPLCSLNTGFSFFGCALFHNNLYAVKGCVYSDFGGVEKYNFDEDKWLQLPPFEYQHLWSQTIVPMSKWFLK